MKSYDYYYLAKRNLLSDAENRGRVKGKLVGSKRVHISAVCGKAMASIACMLSESGYKVTGSDVSFHPPMSDVLNSHNITCLKPSIDNLDGVDLLVVGNMLPAGFVEVKKAKELNIPMMSGSEIVSELFQGKKALVVAGTHGKTTISSLLAHVYKTAKKFPAYMIGGVFQDSGESFDLGKKDSRFAIYEGDEYDCAFFDKAPKFLRYNPSSVILTSIEHDHIDLYPTFEDYKQAFQFLVDDLPNSGFLIINDLAVKFLDLSKCKSNIFTYGVSDSSDYWFEIENINSDGTVFSIFSKEGNTFNNVKIPLFGEYNVLNATSVFLLSHKEGLSIKEIYDGLESYGGVRERQELLGIKNGNINIIRDFAHHPTAVKVTLEGLKSHYPNRRIVCVFEPRSITSRRKMFETEYPKSLVHSDVSILVTPPFKENDKREDFMDVEIVKNMLEKENRVVYTVENPDNAIKILIEIIKENDIVIFMSNGDFGGIPEKFLNN